MDINKVSRIISINNMNYDKPNEVVEPDIKRLDKYSGKTFEEILKSVIGMKRYRKVCLSVKKGDHIKTTKEYKEKMYEPLYFEEILDGEIISIDKNDVVTFKLIESTCDFNQKFNYHMESWRVGTIHTKGKGWLELR